MARDAKIIIRVSEDMKEDFQTMAEDMGITMSGLASYVLGNFMREEKLKRSMQEKMLEQVSPELMSTIQGGMKDPQMIQQALTMLAKDAENRP